MHYRKGLIGRVPICLPCVLKRSFPLFRCDLVTEGFLVSDDDMSRDLNIPVVMIGIGF